MSPRELLAAADALLAGRMASMRGCWQRACAGLLRIALEQVLDGYWLRRDRPGMTRASVRSQLLVLPELAGDETAQVARRAWNGLCRAVHHHTYELAPTAAELRGWYDDVAYLLDRLYPVSGGGRAPRMSDAEHGSGSTVHST